MVGKNATFEEIQKQVRNLKLGEFIKFCKDFELTKQVGLNKQELTKIFHKSGKCHKPLIYQEYLAALSSIGW